MGNLTGRAIRARPWAILPLVRTRSLVLAMAVAALAAEPAPGASPGPERSIEVPLRRRRDLGVPAGWPRPPPSRHAEELPAARAQLGMEAGGTLRLTLRDAAGHELVRAAPVPLRWLVPHLPYALGPTPDAFDALLLRLAEFSRLGVRVPAEGRGDLEVLVANNCLRAGLWEVTLHRQDRRTLHGWLELPLDFYAGLVAEANGISSDAARDATSWDAEGAPFVGERLRQVVRELPSTTPVLDPGFAFQAIDQEQATKRGKWKAGRAGAGGSTARLGELRLPVHFADFIEPGRYTPYARRRFDLGFLLEPGRASWREVAPPGGAAGLRHELELPLGPYRLVVGNLDLAALAHAKQRLHGFGVGIAGPRDRAADHAAREGSADRWTYALLRGPEGRVMNSHTVGIETLDLRVRGSALEVVVGSFERITSLVRVRVPLPPAPAATPAAEPAPERLE